MKYNKELEENAKLKNEEQSKSRKELINKKLSTRLSRLQKNERQDLMIDELIKTRETAREFLDVCELSKVKREVLEFEKKDEMFILLIYLFVNLVYKVCLQRYDAV